MVGKTLRIWFIRFGWGVAKEIAPFLSPETIYCDLNTVSPATTNRVALIASSSGAELVKIAIMAAIIDRGGYAAPLLAGGRKATEEVSLFTVLGLTMQETGDDPKKPAALKILRNMSKRSGCPYL